MLFQGLDITVPVAPEGTFLACGNGEDHLTAPGIPGGEEGEGPFPPARGGDEGAEGGVIRPGQHGSRGAQQV